MNDVFLKFSDRALGSGSVNDRPDLMREFKSTIEQFTALARGASEDGNVSGVEENGEEDEAPISPPKRSKTLAERPSSDLPIPEARPDPQFSSVGWGFSDRIDDSTSSLSQRRPTDAASEEFLPGVPMKDATQMLQRWSEPNSTNYFPWLAEITTPSSESVMDVSSAPANAFPHLPLQQFNATIPTPSFLPDMSSKTSSLDPSMTLTLADSPFATMGSEPEPVGLLTPPPPLLAAPMARQIGLPFTYSFQETTFSRRLNRAAVERAFHLISQAELRPQRFNSVFRLSLMYSTRDQIHDRLKEVLIRSAQESLESCGGPFLHLGGAGTHYPRNKSLGTGGDNSGSYTERRVGPIQTLLEKEQQALGLDLAPSHDASKLGSITPKGFEGEWFDADDVAGYLEERGVLIPAQASFVEGEVEDLDETSPMVVSTETDGGASVDFSSLFEPTLATKASIAREKSRQQRNESDKDGRGNNTQIGAPFPFNTLPSVADTELRGAEDLNVFDNAFGSTDFTSSAWFDDSSLGQSNSSPGMTSATTAPSVNDGMEWQMPKPSKIKRSITVEVARLIDGKAKPQVTN